MPNSSGQVVGVENDKAVLYGYNQITNSVNKTNLGSYAPSGWQSKANAINDSGQVAGFFRDSNGKKQAYRWTPGDTDLENLGTEINASNIFGNPVESNAHGINNSGTVVGQVLGSSNGLRKDFKYSDSMVSPVSGANKSIAYGINTQGTVVGETTTFQITKAYPDGSSFVPDLSNQLGNPGISSGKAINDSDHAVGDFFYAFPAPEDSLKRKAFFWDDENGNATILDASPSGQIPESSTLANDINNDDQIVGRWDSGYGEDLFVSKAVIWEQQGGSFKMINLNEFLDIPAGVDFFDYSTTPLPGFSDGDVVWLELSDATGINDQGWIVGNGVKAIYSYDNYWDEWGWNINTESSFLMAPQLSLPPLPNTTIVPTPSALALALIGLVTCSRFRRRQITA